MAIKKYPYEISVWDEELIGNGKKKEIKRATIGSNSMGYLGKATSIKFVKKLDGTHTLTFQMPAWFFDSELGKFVQNEFCDYVFNEKKIKLKYREKWYELYVKDISESHQGKSKTYEYTCTDAFIDELSRNGYGITFSTELYNNVEEIGTFTETILEDSIWHYDASCNWGDFTQYSEEKLFKIPVSQFNSIQGYKLIYDIDEENVIKNAFNGKERNLEMGDDLAREKGYFWDATRHDKGFALTEEAVEVTTDGYIYVPYNQLNFCYSVNKENVDKTRMATEEAQIATIDGITSYLLAPKTIDPSAFIQFMAIPEGADVTIDESGLIVNKDYSYLMTVEQWNNIVNTGYYYKFEDCEKEVLNNVGFDYFKAINGNMAVVYDGYLEEIGGTEVVFGKAISTKDRTEMNISEEIDQFVTVYDNNSSEYDFINAPEEWYGNTNNYRVCSKIATRQVVPQLARNYIQNGVQINSTDGWAIMGSSTSDNPDKISTLKCEYETVGNIQDNTNEKKYYLTFKAGQGEDSNGDIPANQRTIINFGIIGQEKTIEKGKNYYFKILNQSGSSIDGDNVKIKIGEGSLDKEGDYTVENAIVIDYKLDTEVLLSFNRTIKRPYLCIEIKSGEILKIEKAYFFEAFTKGKDFFDNGKFRYSGREISSVTTENSLIVWESRDRYKIGAAKNGISFSDLILFENDVMEGTTYEYKQYFIQQLKTKDIKPKAYDTFLAKKYLATDGTEEHLPLPATKYTTDDYDIITSYFDMTRCRHYSGSLVEQDAPDCSFNGDRICLYQKYGYCPYLFKSQKHCRKTNTLNGEKSNRFNLTQEIGKVFEVYPVYHTEHNANGTIKKNKEGQMEKKVFYITENGNENKLGFRYEKNLSNITRTIDSKEIVTKLLVEDVDSELSKTGLCSIKTAEDNPSKDSFIMDFTYYKLKGLLDAEMIDYDLYGRDNEDMGFLKKLGYYNTQYDKLNNDIINLRDGDYQHLEANVQTNLTAIETAMQEIKKTKTKRDRYINEKPNLESDTYKNYTNTLSEQESILSGLTRDTFYDGQRCWYNSGANGWREGYTITTMHYFDNVTIKKMMEMFENKDKNLNNMSGLMGQYITQYNQLQEWIKEANKYLNKINEIALEFYRKYEPFIKEGTWTDSNYISDNSYYFGAKEVAKESAVPKTNYSISVMDIDILDEEGDYYVDVADTTYIEDVDMFGINQKTGLPNKLKVIISGITYDLDNPMSNTIEVQNYTTQFEDLFNQITATVQSVTLNENIYKRSSNFTATKNIEKSSLQGTLSGGDITLVETKNKNIVIDDTGQSGSDINNRANKYNLNGQGLFFSNDGGAHWNSGVGPKGINADYIKTGSLDAGRVRIVDNDYLYFLWDKDGIKAYRTPYKEENGTYKNKMNDFAQFNKYGLSLVEEGVVRLRAGYEYKGQAGDIRQELPIRDNDIGFFLYDKKGNKIFSTEAGEKSARLSLAGEIYTTDKLLSPKIITYEYSNRLLGYISKDFYNIKLFNNEEYSISFGSETVKITGTDILNAYEYRNGQATTTQFKDYYSNKMPIAVDSVPFQINKGGNSYYFSTTKGTQENTDILINNIFKRISSSPFHIYIYSDETMSRIITDEPLNIDLYLNDNNYYEIMTDEITEAKVQDKDAAPSEKITLSEQLGKQTIAYLVLNNGVYTQKTLENKYLYRKNLDVVTYCYETETRKESGGTGSDNGIAVFINNRSFEDSPQDTSGGFSKRLITAAKKNGNNTISNIFSILADGTLTIGGKIEQKETATTDLSSLSNYIKIIMDEDTISLGSDGIKIGNQSMIDGIMNRVNKELEDIRTIVSNQGLINHAHGIDSIMTTSTPTSESLKIHKIINDIPTGEIIHNDGYIRVFCRDGQDFVEGAIPFRELSQQLQIKTESSYTQTAGAAEGGGGGGSTYPSGYIVEGL